MKALDVDFTVLFIVNKFNDGELEKVNDFTEKVTNRIIVDYIYPKPNNEYYSTKFIDAMYSKTVLLLDQHSRPLCILGKIIVATGIKSLSLLRVTFFPV